MRVNNLSQLLGLKQPLAPHTLKLVDNNGPLTFQCQTCTKTATIDKYTWYEMVVNRHNPHFRPIRMSLTDEAHVRRIRAWAVCPNPRRTS